MSEPTPTNPIIYAALKQSELILSSKDIKQAQHALEALNSDLSAKRALEVLDFIRALNALFKADNPEITTGQAPGYEEVPGELPALKIELETDKGVSVIIELYSDDTIEVEGSILPSDPVDMDIKNIRYLFTDNFDSVLTWIKEKYYE